MCDVRRVYALVHGCVCVSHADEMKNRGALKIYVPAERKSQQYGRVTCVPT